MKKGLRRAVELGYSTLSNVGGGALMKKGLRPRKTHPIERVLVLEVVP